MRARQVHQDHVGVRSGKLEHIAGHGARRRHRLLADQTQPRLLGKLGQKTALKIMLEGLRVCLGALDLLCQTVHLGVVLAQLGLGGQDLDLKQAMDLELSLYNHLFTTADRREGVASFNEKRTPAFRGE